MTKTAEENLSSKVPLTAGRIRSFSCPSDKPQVFLWDTEVLGLAVRATPTGAKAYIFQAKLNGNVIRITIGDVNTWPLSGKANDKKSARAEARRLKTLIDQGTDPRDERKEKAEKLKAKRAEVKRKATLVSEAWAIYLEELKTKNSDKNRPRTPRYITDHEDYAAPGGKPKKRGKGLTVAGPLAPLMPLKLSELTPAAVSDWLATESATRATSAAYAYRMLRAFIRWCEEKPEFAGIVEASSYNAKIVRQAVPKGQAKEGDSLQREQLKAWFDSIKKIQNQVISAYLQGLLITGARREELATLKWGDVDFQWRSLTIKDKVEGLRIIPLTPYLAHLLASLPRRNEWVFSSPAAADGKLAEPRIAHTKALQSAGIPHVSLHGLRRSFGTLAEWVEAPVSVIAQIQGHKPSATTEKHYKRRPLDLLRMWHDKIEAWMLAQAEISFDASQIKLGLHLVQG